MPKIHLPKITGPIWQLLDQYPPVSDDHLHCALHEAGHLAAAAADPFALIQSCYVFADKKLQWFQGRQGADFMYPMRADPRTVFAAKAGHMLAGWFVELKISQAHGHPSSEPTTWSALKEAEAVEAVYAKYAPACDGIKMVDRLASLFKTPPVSFQQAFARMMLPCSHGSYGLRQPPGYTGVKAWGAVRAASWYEWKEHLNNSKVEYSPTWQEFVQSWQIPPIQFAVPEITDDIPKLCRNDAERLVGDSGLRQLLERSDGLHRFVPAAI